MGAGMTPVGNVSSPELARAMGPVAIELLGQPNPKHSRRDELRYGTHGSLSVDLRKGVWADHEAGTGGGVLDLLHQRRGLAKPDALQWLRDHDHLPKREPAAAPAQARRQVAAYTYTTADGEVLFEVVRFEPKEFRQRRPDGTGGWAWNMEGVERVLYRLPETLAAVAAGRVIYVVEGEKAADALARIGLDATCSPAGAGKWRAAYSETIRGADVVILPDNDAPGRDHAANVARALDGIARRVRVVPLPGLAHKADPFDWIEAGGTAEALDALLRTYAPDPAPGGLDEMGELVNPADLQGIDPPEREWIVDGWLPVRTVTSLYGGAGFGKTLLAQQLQSATALGAPFLGLHTVKCRSLAFYCEDDADELHRRQRGICWHYDAQMSDLGAMRWQARAGKSNVMATVDRGLLQLSEFYEFVQRAIVETGARLIILDNIAQLFGGNENARPEVTQFVNALGTLAIEHNAAVLLLGHPGKATDSQYSGSTAWDAAVRSRWLLDRPAAEFGDDQQPAAELADLRVLRKAKANYAGIGDEIALRWSKGAFHVEGAASVQHVIDQATAAATRGADESAFMATLDAMTHQGRNTSASPSARNYAPKVMSGKPTANGISRKRLTAAMERLFDDGVIEVGTFGRGKNRHPIYGIIRTPHQPDDPKPDPARDHASECAEPALDPALDRAEPAPDPASNPALDPALECAIAPADCATASSNPLKSLAPEFCAKGALRRAIAPANPLISERASCVRASPYILRIYPGDAGAVPTDGETQGAAP